MRRKKCPECSRRLPYAAHWCRGCGWSRKIATGAIPDTRSGAQRAFRVLLTMLGISMLLIAGRVIVTSETVIEWYADFAFQHLPSMFSGLGPGASAPGAYFYCVKTVARQLDDRDAVETFASIAESELEQTDERQFTIRSFVDQTFDDGRDERRSFSCSVRYERGRWSIAELEIDDRAVVLSRRQAS